MKIALCLYGQPRVFREGYVSISKIIKEYNPDIFTHFWISDKKYEVSPWRNSNNKSISESEPIISLYKPKRWMAEKSTYFVVGDKSNGYNKTQIKQNCSNVYSQVHSRQKVRDLLFSYSQEHSIKYDYVIATRYDVYFSSLPDDIFMNEITMPKTHPSRKFIFDDNFGIYPFEDFLKVFNFTPFLERYVNFGPEISEEFKNYIIKSGIDSDLITILNGTVVNMENLLFASILQNDLYFKCKKNSRLEIDFADRAGIKL